MAIESKKVKFSARERIKARLRKKISGTDIKPRMSVFKSGRHTYAQIISDESGKTIASASSLDSAVIEKASTLPSDSSNNNSASTKSVKTAMAVGMVIAERAKEKGIQNIVFDRNGFLYHGRIKAIADGARQGGLEF